MRRRARSPAPPPPPGGRTLRERARTAAAGALAFAIAGAALLVDPGAAAAFDAPKRLATMVGLALASVLALVGGARPSWRRLGRAQRLPLAALLLGLACAVAAAVVSPRRPIALDALRVLLVTALALPLGASRVLAGRARSGLLGVFAAAAALGALASLAQSAGLPLVATAAITGRTDTGGFLGNEGHLSQQLALAGVACGALLLVARPAAVRAAAAVVLGLALVGVLVNRNLTAVVTLAAGGVVAVVLARGRRGLGAVVLGTAALTVVVAAHAPFRARLGEAVAAARQGEWDALTTYRLGPWAAALEMVRARPGLGFGPGTFGAEFVTHRLAAEERWRERLTIPLLTSTFGEAHSEYLQAAADAGLPAAGAAVTALVVLLGALAGIARTPADPRAPEAVLLAAVLAAGAVAALTWFPLQLPATAVPLLLAAGRGWRLLGAADDVDRAAPAAPSAALTLVVAAALAAAVALEVRRYGAERALAGATAPIAAVAEAGRVVPAEAPRLERLAARAAATAARLPADSRGLVAAGTALLLAGKPAAARRHHRAALARGERAEIDLNLARAYALEGRTAVAEAALLRAAWLSPALLTTLPAADRRRLEAVVADLEARLRAGTLAAPPPLPADE